MKKKSLKERCKLLPSPLSLYELAEKSGLSVSQLYAIDRDPKRNVEIDTMKKIYKATNLRPIDYLDLDVNIF